MKMMAIKSSCEVHLFLLILMNILTHMYVFETKCKNHADLFPYLFASVIKTGSDISCFGWVSMSCSVYNTGHIVNESIQGGMNSSNVKSGEKYNLKMFILICETKTSYLSMMSWWRPYNFWWDDSKKGWT